MTTSQPAVFDLEPCPRPAGCDRLGGQRKHSAALGGVVCVESGRNCQNCTEASLPVARYDMRCAYVALRSLRSLRPRALRLGGCKNNGQGNGNGNGKSQGNGGSLGMVSMGVFLAGEGF